MATNNNEYSASSIKKLEPREHVRHRVGMYLGSNSDEGVTVAVREIADNSIDEVLAGHGNCVNITFHADGSAEVQDFGRGLPIDKNDEGINGIILTLGTIGSGGKFNSDNYAASGGLNGVGASAAIATARGALVTVYRGGKMYKLGFKEGLPGFFADEMNPDSKFTDSTELKVSKDPRSAADQKKNPTGTKVRFWPDFSVFLPGSKFLVEDIKFRMRSTAFLVQGLSITINDLRDPLHPVEDVYCFPGGIQDMLPTLTSHNFITKPLHIKTEGSFNEVATVMDSNGKMAQAEVTRNINIDFAFGYTGDEETVLKSYVNIINTKNGGTHESGLWRAMSRVLVNYAKSVPRLLGAKEESPTLEDVKDGFIGVLSIGFPEPTFSGQAKEELKTPQITSVISQVVGNELKSWLDNKKNEVQAKLIAKRIVEASRIRIAARDQKDTARKKSALETSTSMPSKLVECGEVSSPYSELFLVEGDSALGTMRAARDARYQALLPLRGKILNVQKSSTSDMLKNAECSAMIQVMGAGSGRSFTMEDARYSKIILASDADVDGAHITCLLVTFFWKYMQDFVKAGKLYSLIPPLFAVKTMGKNGTVEYAVDQAELDAIMKRLDAKKIKYEVARNKGLGEMDPEPTWDTLMNPESRRLKRINADDAQAATEMLELAMGAKVPPRRDWIVENRDKLSDEDLTD
jgi:DNA gyrase subunit B